MTSELEAYCNLKQLSQTLGMSKSNIHSLIRRGLFPTGIKLGHCRRWRVSDVNNWLSHKGGETA